MLQVPSVTTRGFWVLPWSRFERRARRPAPHNSTEDPISQAASARRDERFQRLKDATQANYLLKDGRWFLTHGRPDDPLP